MAVPPVIFGGNEPSICQNLLFIKEIFKGSSELASFAPHALKGRAASGAFGPSART